MHDLLAVDQHGLACAAGGFYVDPWGAVPKAVITHAHGDHARPGSGVYYCAAPGKNILAARLPGAAIEAVPYGERFSLGGVQVSFHPAGHILGSAQVRVESGEGVWVVSGDYKRQVDATCHTFEVVPCDVLISEATFAMPIYAWEPARNVARYIADWWAKNAAEKRATILFAYALGKAQRLLAELWALREEPRYAWIGDKTALLHGALTELTGLYRAAGAPLLPTAAMNEEPVKRKRGMHAGDLVLAPPSASGSPWMRRFGQPRDFETGFASGWMRVRGIRRRRGYDRGFVISDHADWNDLLTTVQETGARRVLATHGYTETLSRHLRERGLDAQPLRTAYEAEGEG